MQNHTLSRTGVTSRLALGMLLWIISGLSGCASELAGCPTPTPTQLPSGDAPGVGTEGVAGGAKQVVWGSGVDAVDLRVGVSYYAPGGDTVVASTQVRGNPAIVFQFEPDYGPDLGLTWSASDCSYTVFLSSGTSAEELVDFAERY